VPAQSSQGVQQIIPDHFGLGESEPSTEWWEWAKGQMPDKGLRPDDIPSALYQAYK